MRGAGRPASVAACADPGCDVVVDRALVGHPEDCSARLLAGDAQHGRPECCQQDGHRHGLGDVERAVHAVAVVLDVDGPRPAERGIEHLEIVAHQANRTLVRQPQLTVHDPIVRRAEPQGEPAAACQLSGQRLLRHRDGMARLNRHHGGADFDAVGHLAEQGDRRHGVEVAGNLRNPKRGKASVFGGLGRRRAIRPGGQRAIAPCRTRSSGLFARTPPVTAHSGPTRRARRGETARRRADRCPLLSNASRGRAAAAPRWRPGRRRGSSR